MLQARIAPNLRTHPEIVKIPRWQRAARLNQGAHGLKHFHVLLCRHCGASTALCHRFAPCTHETYTSQMTNYRAEIGYEYR
jgi:hypothetical protein